jgi:hypothetical protein
VTLPEWPERIEPPNLLGLQRNALRVEIITPMNRCRLRPRDERAQWIADNRPFHLREFWTMFGYCSGKNGCATCKVYLRANLHHDSSR